jgi:prokaryotic ubiquitin-like protein Pup
MAKGPVMAQAHKEKQSAKTKEAEPEVEAKTDLADESLAADIDAMLDEIDNVLEENAEEFVMSYVQQGGQ